MKTKCLAALILAASLAVYAQSGPFHSFGKPITQAQAAAVFKDIGKPEKAEIGIQFKTLTEAQKSAVMADIQFTNMPTANVIRVIIFRKHVYIHFK